MRPMRWLREAALRLLSPVGVPRTVNGMPLRVHPASRHAFAPVYDAGAAEYLRRTLPPGSEAWNVGANVGVYVLQLANWLGPEGRVVAFEPNPAARRLLDRNVRLNRLQGRVEIVPAAVGADAGFTSFFVAGADGMGRAGRPNPQLPNATSLEVPLTTLNIWARHRGRHPAAVVMDIEGWEIAALSGADDLLRTATFVVELHPAAWCWSGHNRRDLEALLATHDLQVIALSGQADALGQHGQVLLRRRS